jgi:hypothetical protein
MLRRPMLTLEPTALWNHRRVGGQPRQHLAGLQGLEELRALAQHVRVDRLPQIGGHPLADPAHHVEARRGRQAQHHGDAEQEADEMARIETSRSAFAVGRARETPVDQQFDGVGQRQRRAGGEQQEQQGQRDLPAVARDVGQQRAQRPQLARRQPGAGRCRCRPEPVRSPRCSPDIVGVQPISPRRTPQAPPSPRAPKASIESRKPLPRVFGSRA